MVEASADCGLAWHHRCPLWCPLSPPSSASTLEVGEMEARVGGINNVSLNTDHHLTLTVHYTLYTIQCWSPDQQCAVPVPVARWPRPRGWVEA